MKRLQVCVLAIACAALSGTGWGQDYPNRPIRFVVATAPGGIPDLVARFLAPRLTEVLGQQIVIDNRAGANALIGADVVARAPADGYTWLFGTGQNTINPSVVRKMPHDIVRDFTPVCLVLQTPYFLMVHPAVQARSVKEFIALAKSNPKKLNFGSGGMGSSGHLAGALFETMAGVELVHVPYKGIGPALTDLLGGHLELAFPTVASAMPFHKAGRLRALGVTSPRRHPSVPELPTIAETVPRYESRSWIGVLVPAGTPKDIVYRLNAVFVKLVDTPEIRDALIAQGADPETNTPEAFARFIREEVARGAKIVKAAGVVPE